MHADNSLHSTLLGEFTDLACKCYFMWYLSHKLLGNGVSVAMMFTGGIFIHPYRLLLQIMFNLKANYLTESNISKCKLAAAAVHAGHSQVKDSAASWSMGAATQARKYHLYADS